MAGQWHGCFSRHRASRNLACFIAFLSVRSTGYDRDIPGHAVAPSIVFLYQLLYKRLMGRMHYPLLVLVKQKQTKALPMAWRNLMSIFPNAIWQSLGFFFFSPLLNNARAFRHETQSRHCFWDYPIIKLHLTTSPAPLIPRACS